MQQTLYKSKTAILLSVLFIFIFFDKNALGQTILDPGDLVIVGVNTNYSSCGGNPAEDRVSFVCFKDITTNTAIDITDNGWQRLNPNQFGDNEGIFRFTYTAAAPIPAGTVFTLIFLNDATGVDPLNPDWSVVDLNVEPRWLNMNTNGDQIYIMQGGSWNDGDGVINTHDATYDNGVFLFGFNTKSAWIDFANSSTESGLHPEVTPCYHMEPTSGNTSFISYGGPITATTQLEWISRISDPLNWVTYANCSSYSVISSISIQTSGMSIDCTICNGCGSINETLTFNLPAFGGPFNVVYTDGTNNFTLNGINDGHTENVTVNMNTTYSLVSVTDDNGCPVYSNFDGEAVVSVTGGGGMASLSGGGIVCSGSCTTISINISGGVAPYTVNASISFPPIPR